VEPVWSASILARKENGSSRIFEVVERTESVFWEMLLWKIRKIREEGYVPSEIRIERL